VAIGKISTDTTHRAVPELLVSLHSTPSFQSLALQNFQRITRIIIAVIINVGDS